MRQNTISAEKIREQHELEALLGLPSLKKTAVGRPTTTTPAVGRPTTTTPAVGRPTTTTSLTRVHPQGSVGITKNYLPPPRHMTPGLLLDQLIRKHRDHKRAELFGRRDWTDIVSIANHAYHAAEAKALRDLLEAIGLVHKINKTKLEAITKDTANRYEKQENRRKYCTVLGIIMEYLADAIAHFGNAIDGRIYTCDTFYGGKIDPGHHNAIMLIKREIRNVGRYIDDIKCIINAIKDITVENPEIATYTFESPILAVSEKKTLMFPAKCYPADFLEKLEQSSIAVR